MQQALFIDEILRQILEFCSEDGKNTLCAIARSCKAWKDPALDYLWMRLFSVAPLIQLIPGVKFVNGIYILESSILLPDMALFHSYARRVKHINYCRNTLVHRNLLSVLAPGKLAMHRTLPCLLTAQLSFLTCDTLQASLSLSPKLQDLRIDLGFRTRLNRFRDDKFCQYLEQIAQVAPALERLSIRGLASKLLNNVVSSMRNIQCLSLCLGNTLEPETLKAVASFPLLKELDLHAGHLDVDSLSNSLQKQGFPSLQKLRIRARASVIELLLDNLCTDVLHTLRVEAEDPAYSPFSWSRIFNSICSKTVKTLRSLTLEHHIEIDDTDIDSNTIAHPNSYADNISPQDNKANTQLPVDILKLLRKLAGLRSLILDMTLPPNVCDEDIEILADGWLELEHLEIGFLPTLDCAKRLRRQPLTETSLLIFARKLPKLRSLVWPADLNAAAASKAMSNFSIHGRLERLTVGFPCKAEPLQLARYLQRLFPSLTEVDGLPEQEENWKQVQAALHRMRLEPCI